MTRTYEQAEQRLREVCSLRAGWYDNATGDGAAPHPSLYCPLRSLLQHLLENRCPMPFIYPRVEGGVQFEWSGGLSEIRSVEASILAHVETAPLLRDRAELVTDCGKDIWAIDVAYMNDKIPPFTEGSWRWRVNQKSKSVDVISDQGGGAYVMEFQRYGTRGAAPAFPVDGFMQRVDVLAEDIPGQEHNNSWRQTTKHPNALVMALAPDLYRSLMATEAYLEDLEKVDVLDARGKVLLEGVKKQLDVLRKGKTT